MKLVKGSLAAKKYMANIRSKKKINGNEKKQFYIEFLNKDKGFKKDIKYFSTFNSAKNFALKTFDKFDSDMIKQNNMKKIGSVKASKEVKKTLKEKKLYMPHGYATAKRKRKIGEVHTDTKSHNVKIDIMSGVNPYIEKIKKGLIIIQNEIDFLNKEIKVTKEILIKKSMFNRKKYLMNELNIGKQLLKKF